MQQNIFLQPELIDTQSLSKLSSCSPMDEWTQEEVKSLKALRMKEFHPEQYYWLFNPDLKFSERPTFNPEEDLSPSDYKLMVF